MRNRDEKSFLIITISIASSKKKIHFECQMLTPQHLSHSNKSEFEWSLWRREEKKTHTHLKHIQLVLVSNYWTNSERREKSFDKDLMARSYNRDELNDVVVVVLLLLLL